LYEIFQLQIYNINKSVKELEDQKRELDEDGNAVKKVPASAKGKGGKGKEPAQWKTQVLSQLGTIQETLNKVDEKLFSISGDNSFNYRLTCIEASLKSDGPNSLVDKVSKNVKNHCAQLVSNVKEALVQAIEAEVAKRLREERENELDLRRPPDDEDDDDDEDDEDGEEEEDDDDEEEDEEQEEEDEDDDEDSAPFVQPPLPTSAKRARTTESDDEIEALTAGAVGSGAKKKKKKKKH